MFCLHLVVMIIDCDTLCIGLVPLVAQISYASPLNYNLFVLKVIRSKKYCITGKKKLKCKEKKKNKCHNFFHNSAVAFHLIQLNSVCDLNNFLSMSKKLTSRVAFSFNAF